MSVKHSQNSETTLGEVLSFKYGKALPERERRAGDVPVYGSNGNVGFHSAALIHGPAIIVGRKGSVGEVHLCDGPCWPIDTTYFVDEFGNNVATFWYWYLKFLKLGQLNRATAIPGLNREDAYRLRVLVPEPQEQRRLVSRIEGILRHTTTTRDEITHCNTLLERCKRAIRLIAWGDMGGEPALPAEWKWTTIEEICEEIVDCPHSTPKWADQGEICIRTTNFRPGKLDLSEVRYVSLGTYKERISRQEPQSGDIVYSREGGILGIACQIPPQVKLCLGQRMMLMRADPKKYSGTLLMHVLNSTPILDRVRELTGGSASPHLNVGDIKKFQIPLPPRDKQDRIVKRIEHCIAICDGVEDQLMRAAALADRLDDATLAKAFSGDRKQMLGE
jgi:type I restriction enzyme S subunit